MIGESDRVNQLNSEIKHEIATQKVSFMGIFDVI